MRISFNDIDNFLTFCKSASRQSAAGSLGIAPAALNRVIQRVEDAFGLVLVVRHARGVCMTREGEKLMPVLQRISADYQEAAFVLSDLHDESDPEEGPRGWGRERYAAQAVCA